MEELLGDAVSREGRARRARLQDVQHEDSERVLQNCSGAERDLTENQPSWAMGKRRMLVR